MNRMTRKKGSESGSFTIEFAVVLPVFLFITLLFLYALQAICIQSALNHVIKETGKEMAAYAYPLALLEEENKADGLMQQSDPDDTQNYKRELCVSLLENSGRKWANMLMQKHLEDGVLKRKDLNICFIQLPKKMITTESLLNKAANEMSDEKHFRTDDVVLKASCSMNIKLPFIGNKTIEIQSASVEKAWLNGSNGNYTDNNEKSIFIKNAEQKMAVVYITKTGEKYHLSGCRYLRKSRIPILLEEAEKKYQACKICCPPGL